MMEDVVSRLREFLEVEARSGSMDFDCITPLYVYRMWGGAIPGDHGDHGDGDHGDGDQGTVLGGDQGTVL